MNGKGSPFRLFFNSSYGNTATSQPLQPMANEFFKMLGEDPDARVRSVFDYRLPAELSPWGMILYKPGDCPAVDQLMRRPDRAPERLGEERGATI